MGVCTMHWIDSRSTCRRPLQPGPAVRSSSGTQTRCSSVDGPLTGPPSSGGVMAFLSRRGGRSLNMEGPAGFRPLELPLGTGPMALEVAVLEATRRPTNPELRQLHDTRLGRRAAPVVVVVLWGDGKAAI